MASMLGTQSSSGGSSYNQNMPAFDQAALSKMFGQAFNMFTGQNSKTNKMSPAVQKLISNISNRTNTANNAQLNGGIYSKVDPNSLLSQIKSFSNTPSQTGQLYSQIMGGSGNSYADALKNSLTKDAARTLDISNAKVDAGAAGAGMSGGSRQGVAQALMTHDVNQNLQDNLAKIGYDSFNQDLQNKMGIAQQADSNTLNRQGMFANLANQLISGKNSNITNAIGNAGNTQNTMMGMFAPGQMNWSNLQNLSAALSNPMILSNGSSSSYSGK